jgi:protein-arginine kinase activator protein McsA
MNKSLWFMLCENCNKEEATVHLIICSGTGNEKRNLCESCFRQSDVAKKIASGDWTVSRNKEIRFENGPES